MKKALACLSALALIASISNAAFAAGGSGTETPSAPAAPVVGGEHHEKEHHPHMHKAHHALENAKKALEEAAHDYGGHRAAALEHVNAALKEVDEALNYDKK